MKQLNTLLQYNRSKSLYIRQQGAYTRVHRGVKKKRKVVNDSQVDLV